MVAIPPAFTGPPSCPFTSCMAMLPAHCAFVCLGVVGCIKDTSQQSVL